MDDMVHNPRRGEVWLVNLDPTVGSEMQKSRPCVVVTPNAVGRLPLRLVVPVTEWNGGYATAGWMAKIIPTPDNGLDKDSAADAFQMRSVSVLRFVRLLGTISPDDLDAIMASVLVAVGAPASG